MCVIGNKKTLTDFGECFRLERITRLARLASALADTHPTDEQSPGLFFASQRSFRVSTATI